MIAHCKVRLPTRSDRAFAWLMMCSIAFQLLIALDQTRMDTDTARQWLELQLQQQQQQQQSNNETLSLPNTRSCILYGWLSNNKHHRPTRHGPFTWCVRVCGASQQVQVTCWRRFATTIRLFTLARWGFPTVSPSPCCGHRGPSPSLTLSLRNCVDNAAHHGTRSKPRATSACFIVACATTRRECCERSCSTRHRGKALWQLA